MLVAILIYLLLIIILTTNIHFYIVSEKDTIKTYMKVGFISFNIPHQRIISKLNSSSSNDKGKRKSAKRRGLILNIISHSTVDHIYIAKYINRPLYESPISCGFYILVTNILLGVLHCRTRLLDKKNLRLQYVSSYENIDYYLALHLNLTTFIWAAITI